jgi:hypothetical protein
MIRKPLSPAVLALLAAGAMLSSCVMVVRERPGSDEWSSPEEYRETYAFEPGGTISIESGNGAIEISGWKEPEVEIRATRREKGGEGMRVYALKDLRPEVKVDRTDTTMDIRTGDPDGEEGSPTVDCALQVPESASFGSIRNGRGDLRILNIYGPVGIEIQEGDIHIENFSGSLKASLDQGAVDAEVLDLRSDDEIRITVRRGNIVLRLQASASAVIEADAANGKITSDFDLGRDLPATKLSARMGGDKGATISLTALAGDIRILKTE